MAKQVKVQKYPPCDFCTAESPDLPNAAKFDGKTKMGPWANMCEGHMEEHGYPNISMNFEFVLEGTDESSSTQ